MDGLRAYSALGIVMMHVQANLSVKPTTNYLTTSLIPFFTDFTLLFMLVSGFSLCCGYYERIKSGTISPNQFYKKRYVRILPFFALLCLIDFAFEPSWDTLAQVYANITLCFNLLPEHDITVIGVGWFLGVVFVFYMLFPFFVFLLDNKRRAWFSLLLAIGLLFIAFVRFGDPHRSNIVFATPYFLMGGIVYLYRKRLVETIGQHKITSALVVVILTITFFATRGLVQDKNLRYIIELTLFTTWLVYAIGTKDVVLNNRVVHYLSGISMEIYLCHMLFFQVVKRVHIERFVENVNILYIITLVLVLCGAIVFSHVAKYYVLPPILKRIVK